MVRRTGGIFETDPVAEARGKLATLRVRLPSSRRRRGDAVPLAAARSRARTNRRTSRSTCCSRRAGIVEHLSEREPLLLVFEDLHWADDALLDLIDYLVAHVRDHRVVFLALARPEFLEGRPTWGAGMIGHTTLPLEPLTPARPPRSSARCSRADPTPVREVVATAGGNPLFIEELVAALEDDPTAGELPATVRAAIAARVDALPPVARTALLNASVIGQTFWRDVVEGIGEIEDIDAALEALEARGLVHRGESRVDGDIEYAFKHVLIRDTAYGTLPRAHAPRAPRRHRSLHRGAASEARSSRGSSRTTGARPANPNARSATCSRPATRARDALAVEETYDLFTRALELAQTDEDRRRIRLARALALEQLEDYARADRSWRSCCRSSTAGTRSRRCSRAGTRRCGPSGRRRRSALGRRAAELVTERGPAELEGPALPCCRRATGCAGTRATSSGR